MKALSLLIEFTVGAGALLLALLALLAFLESEGAL